MKFAACITTMNRTKELDECLAALWNSTIKPHSVIVSDNSHIPNVQDENRRVVEKYPQTIYVEGTHAGVSSNRNNALCNVPEDVDLVSFFADDICVEPNFIEAGIARYQDLDSDARPYAILTGDNRNEFSPPHDLGALGVNFRGFFCNWNSQVPIVVCLYATIFPKSFLDLEKWDENIFLGQEDIELSLRALKNGYQIIYCPEMKVFDTCFNRTAVPSAKDGALKQYEIYVAASRLYVGIKRYKHIFPNRLRLIAFLTAYALSTTRYLIRRHSLNSWEEIMQESNISKL